MPSDLKKFSANSFNRQLRSKNRLPFWRKEKTGQFMERDFGKAAVLFPKNGSLPSSAVRPSVFDRRFRGQGSVEYLFVVVFLVGFIVSVLVPSLQTAEVSYALAGVRTAAVGYEANHSDVRLTRMNYSVDKDQVILNLTVYNRSSDANIATPQDLKDAVLSGIHVLAPNLGISASCANTSNFQYCVVS